MVGDTWYAGSIPMRHSVWREAVSTWRRRIGAVGGLASRAVGAFAGVESRSRVERRAVTSVPWIDSGGFAETVTPERALRLAPVFAAVRILSGNIAALPLLAYRDGPSGRQRLPTPRLFQNPTVQGTPHDWIKRMVTSLVLRGNAVGIVTQRDTLEYPTMIEWVHPDHVQVIDSIPTLGEPGSYTNPIWYYMGRIVPAEDIVHIPWFTMPERVWGLSPMGAYAATVTTGLAAQDYSAQWFTNGGVPPGTFSNANATIDQKEAAVIKARLVASIRSREPIVFGKDWEYKPISVSANEAQFVDTMKLGATQIATIYGIPPEMIGGSTGDSMTYANVEQMGIQFVTFTLLPWLTQLETAFSALLPNKQVVKFDVNALLRTDSATRYKNYELSSLIGLRNRDEMRGDEDMPPIPNGEGADYTPLPIAAGKPVGVPAIRGSDDDGELGRPRLVRRREGTTDG